LETGQGDNSLYHSPMNNTKSNIDKNYKGNIYTTKKIGANEKLLPLLALKTWIMLSHYND
jgi:hypothetical protein